MNINDVLNLFEKSSITKEWGTARLVLYSDGSGYAVDSDGYTLFDFDCIDELLEQLYE